MTAHAQRPILPLIGAALALAAGTIPPAWSAEAPPASVRFASATDETPDFQRHVLPLLGRLGCNGRECHGSFQGQGGFRLSLFGYDFAVDHGSLLEQGRGRVDRAAPLASLILRKPTLDVEHDGGRRLAPGSWQHRLLQRWIEAGAPAAADPGPTLVALEVTPPEIVFARPGERLSLKIVARWSDGAGEDVTPLCRFRSNDDSIAAVSPAGEIDAVGPGDTHVIVFYDNGITPVPVILPVSERVGPRFPALPAPTRIDELVAEKLRKVGVVPSELCSDSEFLRRVSLDTTGTLPTPAEIAGFLADRAPAKRERKIDELLSRPGYAAWWTTRLCDLLGNTEANLPVGGEQGVRRQKTAQWYDWIHRRVRDNVPYDQIVAGIVLGRSREPGQSDADYFTEMTSYFRERRPADFAARPTTPYFWTRGRFTPPQPLRFSHAFLGIRLECAQCHKHPYDHWTKDDYEGFRAFFDGVAWTYADRQRVQQMKESLELTADQDSGEYKRRFAQLAAGGTTVPWQEVRVSTLQQRLERARRTARRTGSRVFTPKLLGGEEVREVEIDDCRAPLMRWLREPDNPYFARAIVNRVWSGYFGVGIVEPPDDMNLANPASNEPLLDHLAREFVAGGYDLKRLHREIARSHAYQRSWRPNETNQQDERNFSRALVRRLPAEVAWDALRQATAADGQLSGLQSDPAVVRGRAIGVSSGFSGRVDGSYAASLFGKPPRETVCDCERSGEPSLLQTIYLRNDGEMHALLDRRDGWLRETAARPPQWLASHGDELIAQAYLRTFSRPPTDEELETAREHVRSAPAGTGLRDLMWALLNSKEFILNH